MAKKKKSIKKKPVKKKEKVTFGIVINKIWVGIKIFFKCLWIALIAVGIGWIIIRVLFSKNKNKVSFIMDMFVSNEVSDEKKKKVNTATDSINNVIGGMKGSIDKSKEFLKNG